ncbi:Non-heme 11 kDa protein of cytochrome bc1 complex [Fistulina hepatica ATCC 64428]|uniref:Non-heme 11 kDa protein of cytochrome bc1 complex n=1 Tax=Fistulina hepatica ATCC 64428 TaxID=1128425 RepID=A0A0D7AP20_9AGAR|nr:Non-heme 11 kDa protein of cytochrome bc1 complex [Fistulina hepatica ATCC 64428]
MGIADFFSSFMPTVHADSEPIEPAKEESVEDTSAEGEEEEEPEDVHPAIREECKQSAKCRELTQHFEHCQERVESGGGFKGEDCVEELMMHCVDECAAPKLFSKLK